MSSETTGLKSHSPIINKILCFYLKAGEHPFKQRIVNYIIKIIGNKRFESKTRYGFKMSLDLRDLIQRTIFYTGIWEMKLTEFIFKNLTSEDIFFDIGCNVGYFSLLAANKSLKVISIDPDPDNIKTLNKNTDLNKFNNIKSYAFGLNNKNDQLTFYRAHIANNGYSGFIKRNSTDEFITEVFSLDSLIYEKKILPKPTIIKIDTEGWEEKIFLGAAHLLRADPPRIIVFEAEETCEGILTDFNQIKTLLESHNYKVIKTLCDDFGTNHIAIHNLKMQFKT